MRFASRAPELTTELCRSTRKLHKLAWHSEGREGRYRAALACARSRPPPSDASRCPARSSAGARKTSPRRGTSPPAAGDCHATFERRCGSSSSVPNLRLVLLAFPRPPRAKRPDRGARHLSDKPRARHLPGPRPRPARGQDVVFAGLPRSVDRPGGVRPGVEVRGVLRGARRDRRAGVRVRVPRERHRAGTYGGFGADRHEVRRAVPGHRARRVRHERLARPRVPPGARRMRLVRDPDARGGAAAKALVTAAVGSGASVGGYLDTWATFGVTSQSTPLLASYVRGATPLDLACYFFFLFVQLAIVRRGVESIKTAERIAAPFLCVLTLAMFGWAWQTGGGRSRGRSKRTPR